MNPYFILSLNAIMELNLLIMQASPNYVKAGNLGFIIDYFNQNLTIKEQEQLEQIKIDFNKIREATGYK